MQTQTKPITVFKGRWTKLSNYSLCAVWYEDHIYPTNEHAYQAQKFTDADLQKKIRDCPTPNVAKQTARALVLELGDSPKVRKDWKTVSLNIMLTLLREKFNQEPERSILLSTGEVLLVEGNWWHDNFFGDCTCAKCQYITGENWLGKLLMKVRYELHMNFDLTDVDLTDAN